MARRSGPKYDYNPSIVLPELQLLYPTLADETKHVLRVVCNKIIQSGRHDLVKLDSDESYFDHAIFEKGMEELLEKQVLFHATTPSMYWTNINHLFSVEGARVLESIQ